MKKIFLFLPLLITYFLSPIIFSKTVHAIVDPLVVPNNKFGIHIIQPTPDESSPAAELVNANGDWGYITVLMEQKDKRKDKWQQFFNDLRRRHLIPIVRLATEPEGKTWKRPNPDDADSWADFLNSLNWPTKNRYVIIFNEPNQAHEWGGVVDAKSYALVLDKLILALKKRSEDFFILNGGFDASAPQQLPTYQDEINFLQEMKQAVPDIFEKLDGWVSHSYPNPEFSGSPDALGRGTVRTYVWELQQLRNLGVVKNLPVFITETGWKHAEGLRYDPSLPSAETVSQYYQNAFAGAWNSSRIVAVTPFLLSYQETPFDHFSFKKIVGEKQNIRILGAEYPDYYPQYQILMDLAKVSGSPIQDNLAQLVSGEVYSSIVAGESYRITIVLKNTGQSIWNDREQVKLVPILGRPQLGINPVEIPKDIRVEPGQEFDFRVDLKAPQQGKFKVVLNLFAGNKQFDSPPLEFETEVKSPVILQVKSALRWKKTYQGEYFLRIEGAVGESAQKVTLNSEGKSDEIEARYLLPDYTFEFSLEKPFYKSSAISRTVQEGENVLDFGTLQPDILSALLNPKELWKLLPFSN